MSNNNDILSQEEIDALLTGVDSGDVDTEDVGEQDHGQARSYDLASRDRVVRGRLPALELIGERFARSLRGDLHNMLRYPVEVGVGGVEILKFAEYANTLYVPSSINVIRMRPLVGRGLIVLDAKLIFRMVDQYFGGAGKHTKVEGREFTPTETRVIHRVVEMMFRHIKDAWKSVLDVNVEYVGSEVNPALVNAINPNDVVVVNTFRVDFDGDGGQVHVTLPYSMLEPYRRLLDATTQESSEGLDTDFLPNLERRMLDAEVQLNCTIVEKQVRLRDLMAFKEGDVIPVDMDAEHLVRAGGTPLFYAKLGESRGNLAFEVEVLHDSGM